MRGLTKKEAADSTGKDWSRTQVPGSGGKEFLKRGLNSRAILIVRITVRSDDASHNSIFNLNRSERLMKINLIENV